MFGSKRPASEPAGLLVSADSRKPARGQASKRGCVVAALRAGGVESLGVEQQAMGVDGVDMRLPADERHVMPGPQQQSPIIASDRSGPTTAICMRFSCSAGLQLTGWALTIN